MNRIFEIEELNELKVFLKSQDDIDKLRDSSFAKFLRYTGYKNVEEWNNAVRVYEGLATIGWGFNEALEALRDSFFNGNPIACFVNKHREPHFVEAIWSGRINGFIVEARRTGYHSSPDDPLQRRSIAWEYKTREDVRGIELRSQRNWIPKNPIWVERTVGSRYENSRAVVESIKSDLQSELNKQMRPELHGQAVNKIILECPFSYYDHVCCKCNYVIADEKLKLRQKELYSRLLTTSTKQEIEKNGYYLRNRFGLGPFRTDTGKVKAVITLEEEFSRLNHSEQKKRLGKYILSALNHITNKLGKKVRHDLDLMLTDFNTVLTGWSDEQLPLASK